MRKDGKLKVEEVAVLIGVSVPTINTWYRFKRWNKDNEIAQQLPDFEQEGERTVRLWDKKDIPKLIRFKTLLPQGRGGIMGEVTQRYYHKERKGD